MQRMMEQEVLLFQEVQGLNWGWLEDQDLQAMIISAMKQKMEGKVLQNARENSARRI